ncbi:MULTISPECIES: hypothetical protein [Deefgea]|uniref:Uncharacterized protein n=1 Tax=Deefgea chitinilytica TaxID=570276 RepID=A0ABS2CB00_9NEIS|nr:MULTISPECIES: hypothetical protein [Deefgea]MBM5571324.1 hypothetical protein [Deefgea chitinilytica]MBM9888556.1 hypothetical protein [Deefgea sp. CFH1-16]
MLTSAEQGSIMRQLSDLESGSSRQWYWLEIAQKYPASIVNKKTKLVSIALRCLGINACAAILRRFGIKGLNLYHAASQQFWALAQHKSNDALLFSGCVLALLLGFNRLPASQQLAAWVVGLGGATWQLIRTIRQFTPPVLPESDEERLPGAEASLGLQGMLLAAGVSPAVSAALVKGITQDPAGFLAPLLANLPSLAPDSQPSRAQQIALSTTPWLLIGILSSWLIGLLPAFWGGGLVLFLMLAAGWGIHRSVKPIGLLAISWLACGLLARLTHYI